MSAVPSIPDLSEQSEFPAKGYVNEIVTKIENNLTSNEKEAARSQNEAKTKKSEGNKEKSSTSVCIQCSCTENKCKTPEIVESLILNKNESNEIVAAPKNVNESKNEEKQICKIEDVAKTPLIEKYCSSVKKCFKKILNKAKTLNKVPLFGYPCLPYLCENTDEPSTSTVDRKAVKVRKNKRSWKKRRGGKSIVSCGSIGRRRGFDPAIFEYPDIERDHLRRSRLRPSELYLLSDAEDSIYPKKYGRSFKSNLNVRKVRNFQSDLDFYHSYDRVVFLERPEKRCLVCKSCVRKNRNPYVYNVIENRNFETDFIDYSFKYQEFNRKHLRRKERPQYFRGKKFVESIQCVLAENSQKTCHPKKTFAKSISNRLSKVKCKFSKAMRKKAPEKI